MTNKPTREEAHSAVETLLRWAGDDPTREGLVETPKRVVKAYQEFFEGYNDDPAKILSKSFEEVGGYDDMVLLKNIHFNSHCEHHIVPIVGNVHIAYYPSDRVVGISKLARLVEVFARRLQTQETMTAQIIDAIEEHLKPRGVALVIDAIHQCMTTRGVKKDNVSTITCKFTGIFEENPRLEDRFYKLIGVNN